MDLLILLVERRSQLLSHSDIVDRLWGKDVFVDVETGVHTAIRKVRQALSDSPEAPTCVETVPGKGYRFIAPVEVLPDVRTGARRFRGARATLDAPSFLSRRRDCSRPRCWPRWAGGSGTAPPTEPPRVTVAVLPFENLSGDAEREYLADGLAEETIASFGQIDPDHLSVIGRTSTLAYKRTRKSLAEIGRELGADYLMEGSIRAEGTGLRITSRLVRVRDQTQVWSAFYDRAADQRARTATGDQHGDRRADPASPVSRTPRCPGAPPHAQCRCVRPVPAGAVPRGTSSTPATNKPRRSSTTSARSRSTRTTRSRGPASPTPWRPARSTATCPRCRSRLAPARRPRAPYGPTRAWPRRRPRWGSSPSILDWDWPAAEAAFRRAIALDPGYDRRAPLPGARPLAEAAGRTRPRPSSFARAGWTRSTR